MDYQSLLEKANEDLAGGDYQSARKYFEQAAILGPDESDPYVGLGIVELKEGDLDQAELCFMVASRLGPQCSRAYSGLGLIEQKRGNLEKAAEHYLKCFVLNREDYNSVIGLFEVSKKMHSYGLLKRCLEIYIEEHPEDLSNVLLLGCLYLKDNERWKAELIFSENQSQIDSLEHELEQVREV